MVAPGTKEAPVSITEAMVRAATPHRALPYDKNKDMHYDIISAFIKSMRGSDPDAAVYWLARMIDGGEDPKFIARRMYIAASEDIGNADPQALLVAEAAFRAAEVIGYPECRINLAQAAIYLALAPKSNSAEAAIDAALCEVRNGPVRKVPDYLRDRHRPGSENYGEYKYPHSYPALSAAASTNPASAAGRLTAPTPPPATARGVESRLGVLRPPRCGRRAASQASCWGDVPARAPQRGCRWRCRSRVTRCQLPFTEWLLCGRVPWRPCAT